MWPLRFLGWVASGFHVSPSPLHLASNQLILNHHKIIPFTANPLLCRQKQETLNQRVQGSSPCAPTKPINVLGQDRAPTVKSGGTIWDTALGGQPWPLVGHTVSGQVPTRRGCAPVVAPGAR